VASAISLFSAEKVGALVAEKQRARGANHLFAWSERRTNVIPALAKCLNLLSRWQRLRAIWLKNVNNVSHPTTGAESFHKSPKVHVSKLQKTGTRRVRIYCFNNQLFEELFW
jgi:hypothetical protein